MSRYTVFRASLGPELFRAAKSRRSKSLSFWWGYHIPFQYVWVFLFSKVWNKFTLKEKINAVLWCNKSVSWMYGWFMPRFFDFFFRVEICLCQTLRQTKEYSNIRIHIYNKNGIKERWACRMSCRTMAQSSPYPRQEDTLYSGYIQCVSVILSRISCPSLFALAYTERNIFRPSSLPPWLKFEACWWRKMFQLWI